MNKGKKAGFDSDQPAGQSARENRCLNEEGRGLSGVEGNMGKEIQI
jgi:hypothetical protein